MHAVEFLKSLPQKIPPIVVLYGPQRHFKSQVLAHLRQVVIQDDDASLTRFTGKEVDLPTVTDELRTVSMWGDQRLVVVEEADDFVSATRSGLESYAESPSKKSTLVLDVTSWPKTTRLAKQVAKTGLDIECSPLKGAELVRWLNELAQDRYGVKLERDATALLIELIGEEPGLLESEVSKLTTFVGERKRINLADVRGLVGGWRTETTWAMTNAVRDQHLDEALEALDLLLRDGEAPQKLLGGINFVFRKLAFATERTAQQPLEQALAAASVFPRDIAPAASYLRRLGRTRASSLIDLLVKADMSLKGGSALPERVVMERLLIELAGPTPQAQDHR